jgi:uncharacterized membrane protein
MKSRKMRRVTARHTWDRLKVSFWFAPTVMSVIAILLSWLMLWLDGRIPNEALETSRLVLSGSVDEMRGFLFTMATTVLATAGIVFTLLTLPLSTVATQYGSRLLRVFLGDRVTQFVLGMFVATFVYCIASATSIPPADVNPDAAQITATFGLYLMLGTFGSLILLVQHISTMLQAPNIVAAAGAELLGVILSEAPDDGETENTLSQANQNVADILAGKDGFAVRVQKTGYIQYVNMEYALTVLREKDLAIRLLCQPGDFVSQGTVTAMVWPTTQVDEQVERQIQPAFQIGRRRTPTQDVEYAFNQLVEVAVRAMSPAINDPFTAMTCLDYIGDGLTLFIKNGERSSVVYDQDGKLRVVFEPVTFEKLLDACFNMLRHCSCDNASVLQHMLKVIEAIGQETKSPAMRQKLACHVSLIQAESNAGSLVEQDKHFIQQSGDALQVKLKAAL